MKSLLPAIFLILIISGMLHAQPAGSEKEDSPAVSSAPVQPGDTIRQVDVVDYLAKFFKIKNSDEKRDRSKINFSLFPTSSNISGGKTAFTAFNVAFLLGDKSNTNISTVYFIPYISFDGRYGVQLRPNIWLDRNSWNFTGEYFILNYPQETWGLGGNSNEGNETMVDYKHIRIHQNVMKGILPHFVIGLGYALDYHYDIKVEETETGESITGDLPADKNKTISSGITLPVVFDSRHNSINPEQGTYGSLTYSFYHPFLGSDDMWQSLFFDGRKYFPVSRRKTGILALRTYYWTVITGNVPYLDLPSNGWEPAFGTSSRGIQQNRYRSNALLYFETEYRFGITANGLLGGVVFANATSASQYGTQQFTYWHPAAGAGVRIKFNKYSRTNVTLDYGFSKGYQSVYLNIGEVF
jgi:outer membrane protein assembly factor BamA